MPIDSNRERQIFLAAVEKSPAKARAYLEQACGTDAALLDRVQVLLNVHDESTGLPQQPAIQPNETNLKGQLIAGRFKLLQKLGEGGMGEVWMAEQREPVKRLVAFKIIKTGRDTQQTLLRLRGRTPGPGHDGSSQHRQSARRRHDPKRASPISSWNW